MTILGLVLHEIAGIPLRSSPTELCVGRRVGGRVTVRLMRLGVSGGMLRHRRLLIWRSRSGLWRSSARCNGVKKVGGHQDRTREERIGWSEHREDQHPWATSIVRIEGGESDLSWEITMSEGRFPDMTLEKP